jgi:hypothetical protein
VNFSIVFLQTWVHAERGGDAKSIWIQRIRGGGHITQQRRSTGGADGNHPAGGHKLLATAAKSRGEPPLARLAHSWSAKLDEAGCYDSNIGALD